MRLISLSELKSPLSSSEYLDIVIPEQKKEKRSTTVMNQEFMPEREDLVRLFIHEIRNPLTAIEIANKVMEEETIKEDKIPLKTFTAIISKNVTKIEQLLKKMIDPGSDSLSLSEPTDLAHIIDNTLRSLEDRLFLQGVEVSKSYNPGYFIKGNAEKLSIAFQNIVINAVEAIHHDDGKLWITIYPVKNSIRVVFKDNGKGMDPEEVKHMFLSHYTSKPQGLGMGLMHVKEILEWHEAEISVNSVPEAGTSIAVTFKGI